MAHPPLTGKTDTEPRTYPMLEGSPILASARTFNAWTIADCALSHGARGHHYWETKSWWTKAFKTAREQVILEAA